MGIFRPGPYICEKYIKRENHHFKQQNSKGSIKLPQSKSVILDDSLDGAQSRRLEYEKYKLSQFLKSREIYELRREEYKKLREENAENSYILAQNRWNEKYENMKYAENKRKNMLEKLREIVRAKNQIKGEKAIEMKQKVEFEQEKKRIRAAEYLKQIEEKSKLLLYFFAFSNFFRDARKEAEKERRKILKESVIHKHRIINLYERLTKMKGNNVLPEEYFAQVPEFGMSPSNPNFTPKNIRELSKSPKNINAIASLPRRKNREYLKKSSKNNNSFSGRNNIITNSQSKFGSARNSPAKLGYIKSSPYNRLFSFAEYFIVNFNKNRQHQKQIKQISRKIEEIKWMYN